MTGATVASSPATGINNIDSYTFNLGVTTITYTVTDAFGLTDNCSFTVTVIDNTPPVAVCRNITVYLDLVLGTVTIQPEDVDGGSYDNSGYIDDMEINLYQFDCHDIGPNMVTLTVYDESGNSDQCIAVVTVAYAVVPAPEAAPASDIICNEESTSFVLTNNIPSTTWTWTVSTTSAYISGASDDNTGMLSAITQALTNSDTLAHNLIYTITPSVYGSCTLPSITAEVWVNPRPQIRVRTSDQIICDGGTNTIFVRNPNTVVRGQWLYDLTVTADPGVSGFTTSRRYTVPTNLNETLYNNGTENGQVVYRFTPRIVPEDGGPDCINGTEETVTIVVRPSLRNRYTSELSYYNGFNVSCYGKANGSITITPKEDAVPMTYSWTGPDGFTSTSKDISGLRAGRYILFLTDIYMCTATDTFDLDQPGRLSMNISASVSRDGGYNINCAGGKDGSVTLQAINNVGQVDYMWADGYLGRSRNDLSAGTYKIILSDSNSCLADSTVTLTEPEKIRITFEVIPSLCPEKPDGAVMPTVTGGVPGPDYNYLWSDNSTKRDLIGVREGIYTLIVTDNNGCTETDGAHVTSLNEICLDIPEAISPNRDNINDVWNIRDIELYPNVEITIYNRWGQMVWKSEIGYPTPWDGRSNGKPLPIDSYHYVIELHNGMKPFMGTVTIVK
jgi:gliding motility-associated-like protein